MRSGGLCASLTADSLDELFSQDILGADYVEVRLDHLKEPQQAEHARWDRFPVPVIATCRGVDRGGRFPGSVSEESKILDIAVANGAKFVDIDYQYVRKFGSAEVIASYHNFDHTPPDLESIIEQACATGAQIAKVATHVNHGPTIAASSTHFPGNGTSPSSPPEWETWDRSRALPVLRVAAFSVTRFPVTQPRLARSA